MPDPIPWFEVVAGLPDEPDDLDEVAKFPGPTRFLNALFEALLGRTLGPAVVEREDEVPREVRTAEGRCGDERAGLRFAERTCLETSSIPMHCVWESYGLPGVELRWEFALDKVNVAGFCGFRNRTLRVRFPDEPARRVFEQVWEKVFARRAVFGRAS